MSQHRVGTGSYVSSSNVKVKGAILVHLHMSTAHIHQGYTRPLCCYRHADAVELIAFSTLRIAFFFPTDDLCCRINALRKLARCDKLFVTCFAFSYDLEHFRGLAAFDVPFFYKISHINSKQPRDVIYVLV